MFVSPSIVAAAKRHGSKKLHQSAMPGEHFSQVDAVVELLAESTSPAAQPGARRLLQQMSTVPWLVIRGAHKSPDDPSRHVTVAIGATRYHLRLDGNSSVFDITHVADGQTQRPSGRKPWVGPGA